MLDEDEENTPALKELANQVVEAFKDVIRLNFKVKTTRTIFGSNLTHYDIPTIILILSRRKHNEQFLSPTKNVKFVNL